MRTWLVLGFGDDRQHAGNEGYADELSRHYRYDTFVPNHTQVQPGDLLVIRDTTDIVGVSRIADIIRRETQKLMLRCPQCHRTSLKERVTKLPKYRCGTCKKEFDVPENSMEDCTEFTAEFRGHFAPVHVSASAAALKDACPRYNGQLAMQEIRLELLPASMTPVHRVAAYLSGLPLRRAAAADHVNVLGSEGERSRIARRSRQRRAHR
jgi:putative restriction endonuclease